MSTRTRDRDRTRARAIDAASRLLAAQVWKPGGFAFPPPPMPADAARWARFLAELPARIAEVRRTEGFDGRDGWPTLFPSHADDPRELVRPAPAACGACSGTGGAIVHRSRFRRLACRACHRAVERGVA